MALDSTRWELQSDKDIRYIDGGGTYAHGTAGANYVTVLELHRWLQDLADDASSTGDDLMDITRDTPSDKSFDTIINLINGYNIDDATAEYIYGGSIIQTNGDVIYDGVQIVANSGCHVEVVQNGAIIANDFWNNNHAGTGIKGINPDASNGIAARFMVKVRTGAADTDGRKLLFQTREWGKTYSEFKVNGTGRGINVVPLTYADDLNNATVIGTIAAIADIANTEGYRSIDVNNDSTPENYYSEWDRGANSINTFYERMKWLTRRGSASTLYGLNGELFRGITHEVAVTTPRSGSVSEGAAASWSGGTGQVLARDSAGSATKLWIQLLTGVAPTAGQTITVGAATVTATSGTPSTDRVLSFPFCGVSTGTALIGAYGFGLQALDLSASDKVFDLTNTLRQAPNYVTFTVGGVVSGQDYILVAPKDTGTAIKTNFFTLNGALSGAAVTSVVVNEAIPTWLPAAGSIRILRANGAYTRHAYSAYNTTTKTFTITSHDFSSNNAANGANCFPTPVDVLYDGTTATDRFTGIYPGSTVNLFVRVRCGTATPIKTFETAAALGSGGGSTTAVRTSDL
jgi:hypothetical protein